jgi:sulfur carrier protein
MRVYEITRTNRAWRLRRALLGRIPDPGLVQRSFALISIHLNGEARQVPEDLTLASLVDWLRLPADRVAVERNLEIVPRNQWTETTIGEGDRLEVVHFVGGGFSDLCS